MIDTSFTLPKITHEKESGQKYKKTITIGVSRGERIKRTRNFSVHKLKKNVNIFNIFVIAIKNNRIKDKKKSNLHYTRSTTRKRTTSDGLAVGSI